MSFNKGNSSNFSSEKWKNEAFRGVYNSRIPEKNFKSNLVLVVVLVLESKGLCFQFLIFEVQSPTVYKKKKSVAGFPNVRSRSV